MNDVLKLRNKMEHSLQQTRNHLTIAMIFISFELAIAQGRLLLVDVFCFFLDDMLTKPRFWL